MSNHNRYGFTIVELLIVIVVIAVLASVTVVAFNGVQRRAVNSAVTAAVNATEKAVKIHHVQAGTPIKAAEPGWYHESLVTMGGSCIGKSWPTLAEMQAIYGGYPDNEIRVQYCGVNGGNSSMSRADIQQRMDSAVASSPARDSFSKIPAFPAISVQVSGANTDVRGVRYAYNNSPTTPRSYIFYPLYGKVCSAGDVSVNPNDTVWPSAGNGEWTGSFTTGGNYTSNDTVYCVRTIAY